MSNEANVSVGLQIDKDALHYGSNPRSFQADISIGRGPSPAFMIATAAGNAVDLSQLSNPALCWIQNLDDTNFFTLGIRDPETDKFYPMDEWLPGEVFLKRLSRYLGQERDTPTGTSGPETNQLWVQGGGADVPIRFDAFEA